MPLNSLVSLSIVLTSLILGVFIIYKNRKSLVNLTFGAFNICVSLWVLTNFITDNAQTTEAATFWARMTLITPSFMPFLLLLFSKVFPRQKQVLNKKAWILLSIPAFIFVSLSPTSLNVEINTVTNTGQDLVVGPLYTPFFIYFLIYLIATFINLFKSFKKAIGVERLQTSYLLFGLVSAVIISLTMDVVLPILGFSQLVSLGPLSVLILLISVSYAIVKHRLLDIEVIIRRSLIYSSLLASLIVIYSILVFGLNRLFLPAGSSVFPRITDLVAIVIVAFTVDPLRRLIEKATDKIFFKARYDAEEAIKNVSETISEVLDLNQLVNSLRLTLNRTLKVNKIAIYIKVNNHFVPIDKFGGFGKKFDLNLEKKYFLSKYFKNNKNLVITEELDRTFKENEKNDYKDLSQVVNLLKQNGVAIIVPLSIKEKITGAIFLGEKLSEDIYNNEDVRLLEIFAHQASIALENARLYQEQKKFSEKLQEEVEKATVNLRSANERLKELDKMKDDFVSVVSHELRTPMTAIKSYVWLALNGKAGKLNSKMENYLSKVYESSERLIGLVNDVLDVSHIETGRINLEVQPVSLIKTAKDVMATLSARASEQNIKLTLDKSKTVPMVTADPMKVNEVFVNLIGNALKFTPKGGSVTVSFAKQGDEVETSVTDTGIGIPKEDLSKLFTKFGRIAKSYSTIAQSTGSGLGLYITKKYLDLMKGKVWVNSEVDKGTTFTFSLPISKEHSPKKVHKEHETVSGHINREKSKS